MKVNLTQDEADLIVAAVEIAGLVGNPVAKELKGKIAGLHPVQRTEDDITETMKRVGIAYSDMNRVRKLLAGVLAPMDPIPPE